MRIVDIGRSRRGDSELSPWLRYVKLEITLFLTLNFTLIGVLEQNDFVNNQRNLSLASLYRDLPVLDYDEILRILF